MSAPAAEPCLDPVRRLFYDRIGRFYERTEGEPIVVGTCKQCGRGGVEIHDKDGKGVGPCRAQASLTQKRLSPAEGHMPVFGVPLAPSKRVNGGSAIAGEGSYALIEPDRATYVGNVAAFRPIPADLEAVRGPTAPRPWQLLLRAIENPRPPYLLVVFGKKGDMPLELSDNTAEVVLNGTTPPVRLDRGRLLEILDLGRRFGVLDLRKAIELKDALGTPDANQLLAKFRAKFPELAALLPRIPNSREREKSYALSILEGEAKAKTEK